MRISIVLAPLKFMLIYLTSGYIPLPHFLEVREQTGLIFNSGQGCR